jgi:signal transduction histidine kinase
VRLSNLLRTTSFRLVAIYLTIFSASVVILGVVVYFSVGREIEREVDERIQTETADLQNLFLAAGFERFGEEIGRRTNLAASLDYRLEDSARRHIAGNLPSPKTVGGPYRDGWVDLAKPESASDADDDSDWERALVTTLGNGAQLVVGYELTGVEQARHAVLVAFSWALIATLVLGTVGGVVISSGFLSRIDAMSDAASGIISGNLRQRIPASNKNDDLGRLADTFNRMFDRIEKLIEANRHVSHDIAHDLRRPLARIVRRLEAVRLRHADNPAYDDTIDATIGDINGVLETFNALLRIAQIETGARRTGFRQIDLAAIARDVAEAFQPAAEEQGKTLSIHSGAPLPLMGDKELLSQMIANLIDNALRHTPEGSLIEVRTPERGAARTLTISDTGPGVPESDRARIFERFYRLDASRTTPGDGLGLSLVAAVAELHGAEIVVEDNRPGLRMILKIPGAATA